MKRRNRSARVPKVKLPKHRSIKTEYNGIIFDSETEANYYRYLEKDKTVLSIELQPVYKIIDNYKVLCKKCNGNGKKLNVVTKNYNKCLYCKGAGLKDKQGAKYTADFLVTYIDGFTEIIDVKGSMKVERDFPLRKKLLETRIGQEVIVVRWKDKEWIRA